MKEWPGCDFWLNVHRTRYFLFFFYVTVHFHLGGDFYLKNNFKDLWIQIEDLQSRTKEHDKSGDMALIRDVMQCLPAHLAATDFIHLLHCKGVYQPGSEAIPYDVLIQDPEIKEALDSIISELECCQGRVDKGLSPYPVKDKGTGPVDAGTGGPYRRPVKDVTRSRVEQLGPGEQPEPPEEPEEQPAHPVRMKRRYEPGADKLHNPFLKRQYGGG
jgi:hypothetical protein